MACWYSICMIINQCEITPCDKSFVFFIISKYVAPLYLCIRSKGLVSSMTGLRDVAQR